MTVLQRWNRMIFKTLIHTMKVTFKDDSYVLLFQYRWL